MSTNESSAKDRIDTEADFKVALPPGELLPEHYLDRKLSIRSGRRVLLLGLLSGIALTLCFNVPGLSWLAFIALVPWVVATTASSSTAWAMLGSFLLGLTFWGVNVYWVAQITLGGYLGQCVYLSAYFLLGGWLLRHCYQRRRLPFFLLLPIIWVGLELLRGHVITGFSWLLLGHSQYRWIRLIQIADLTGAYGVSFIVAMTNGLIVDLLLQPLFLRTKSGSKPSVVVAVGVVTLVGLGVFTLLYGTIQMYSGNFRAGPKVALIQENFPIKVTRAPENDLEVFEKHRQSTLRAGQIFKPDLIVWPESMAQPFLYPKVVEQVVRTGQEGPAFEIPVDGKPTILFPPSQFNITDFRNGEYIQKELPKLAQKVNSYLLVGSPARTYISNPDGRTIRIQSWNSAFLCRPDGYILNQRYDKIHLVPFSEYIPLRKSFPPLLKLVIYFSPYDFDHSLESGSAPEIFAITSRDGKSNYRFATPICYEGTVPDLCRKFVLPARGGKIDFLVNISNDGWFNASWELNQHLVCYVFRAVENRIPIARAVNTGISGFVDSTGRLHDLVSKNGRTRGVAGISSAQLQIDSRVSLYSRTGDWFALLCGLGSLIVFVDSMLGQWKHRWARTLLLLMTMVMLADAIGRWLI
ncbi:MAG: apolipoprotein N-acyltransferase [Actinobacteria bacterium]|nr:apolipoprotein N-acyltransferase [Actinomycetota bacterium]